MTYAFFNQMQATQTDVQVLIGTSNTVGNDWQVWYKPRGKAMCSILLIGGGGNGYSTSTTRGTYITVTMPLAQLPDIMYFSGAAANAANTVHS